MADTTALAKRMKENYEQRTRYKLTRRIPTIIRLDGKAFHTYTKGLDKPFDEGLIEDMAETTRFLCQNIQGVKCGYTQSDEISLLLTDYEKFETSAWFDYNIQKVTSIAASMATAKFNQLRLIRASHYGGGETTFPCLSQGELEKTMLAFFDARVFQIPEKEEVVNYFLWRQRDAEKNSVAMLAQSLYSHKELHKKNGSDMQEMCFQKGYNWNDLHFSKKRGSFIVKRRYINGDWLDKVDKKGNRVYEYFTDTNNWAHYTKNELEVLDWVDIENPTLRTKWESVETPMFGKDRNSILKLL